MPIMIDFLCHMQEKQSQETLNDIVYYLNRKPDMSEILSIMKASHKKRWLLLSERVQITQKALGTFMAYAGGWALRDALKVC